MSDSSTRMSALRVFASWPMAVVLLTGFSSGLPIALTDDTLQKRLADEHVSKEVIGLLGAVTLPYALKFLWSPLMDRFMPPFLGRRRGWMVLSQLGLIAGIAAMGFTSFASTPWAFVAVTVAVCFLSGTQDIAADAYRTEILQPEQVGAGASLYVMGYRLGMVCSGALAVVLAGYLPWRWIYVLMACGMLVGVLTTPFGPEPLLGVRPPATLKQAVTLPLMEFLHRRGAWEMLLFILIYKLDFAMVQAQYMVFLTETEFSAGAIGTAKLLGIFSTILGAMVAAVVITRIGIRRSLWTFGLLQGLAGASFTILAMLGKNFPMLVTAVVVENACSGMATAAFVGFIMSLCNRRFTATQFALLTSLMALSRTLIRIPSGWLSKSIDWQTYFILSVLIAIPGLLLLLRFNKWEMSGPAMRRQQA